MEQVFLKAGYCLLAPTKSPASYGNLVVPSAARYDLPIAVLVEVGPNFWPNVQKGDLVYYDLRRGGYNFENLSSAYDVHPGTPIMWNGKKVYMVPKEEVLCKVDLKGGLT